MKNLVISQFGLEMGFDLTQAYFWPAVNKRPTRLWSGFFLTQADEIFFIRRAKNWKIWDFKGKFSNAKPKSKMADMTRATKTWPDSTQVKKIWPRPITSLDSCYELYLWKSHWRSLLTWLRVPCWLFWQYWVEKLLPSLGIEPTTLDLSPLTIRPWQPYL